MEALLPRRNARQQTELCLPGGLVISRDWAAAELLDAVQNSEPGIGAGCRVAAEECAAVEPIARRTRVLDRLFRLFVV